MSTFSIGLNFDDPSVGLDTTTLFSAITSSPAAKDGWSPKAIADSLSEFVSWKQLYVHGDAPPIAVVNWQGLSSYFETLSPEQLSARTSPIYSGFEYVRGVVSPGLNYLNYAPVTSLIGLNYTSVTSLSVVTPATTAVHAAPTDYISLGSIADEYEQITQQQYALGNTYEFRLISYVVGHVREINGARARAKSRMLRMPAWKPFVVRKTPHPQRESSDEPAAA